MGYLCHGGNNGIHYLTLEWFKYNRPVGNIKIGMSKGGYQHASAYRCDGQHSNDVS